MLTCDRLPRSLVTIEERLRERFEAGLVANIEPPDHATRVAILRKRAALDGVAIADPAILDLIADRVTDNIRSLEGALIRVVAYHSLTRQTLDLELAAEVLDAIYPARGRLAPSIAASRRSSPRYFSLSTAELVSQERESRVVWPRQIAIHLARELTGGPFKRSGTRSVDATTAPCCTRANGCQSASAGIDTVAGELDALSAQIRDRQADRNC